MRFFLSRGSISHAAGARRGSIHSCEGHRPLLALLPSGHGERAVARVAGKAPAADRLSQTAASDALSPKANSPSVCLWRLTGKLSRFSKASALKFLTFVTQSSSTNVQHTTTKRAQRRGFLGGACGLRNFELAPPKGFLSLQTETKLQLKSTIKNILQSSYIKNDNPH